MACADPRVQLKACMPCESCKACESCEFSRDGKKSPRQGWISGQLAEGQLWAQLAGPPWVTSIISDPPSRGPPATLRPEMQFHTVKAHYFRVPGAPLRNNGALQGAPLKEAPRVSVSCRAPQTRSSVSCLRTRGAQAGLAGGTQPW